MLMCEKEYEPSMNGEMFLIRSYMGIYFVFVLVPHIIQSSMELILWNCEINRTNTSVSLDETTIYL